MVTQWPASSSHVFTHHDSVSLFICLYSLQRLCQRGSRGSKLRRQGGTMEGEQGPPASSTSMASTSNSSTNTTTSTASTSSTPNTTTTTNASTVPSSSSASSSSSTSSGRQTVSQISVYSGIPDRQTVQVRAHIHSSFTVTQLNMQPFVRLIQNIHNIMLLIWLINCKTSKHAEKCNTETLAPIQTLKHLIIFAASASQVLIHTFFWVFTFPSTDPWAPLFNLTMLPSTGQLNCCMQSAKMYVVWKAQLGYSIIITLSPSQAFPNDIICLRYPPF